MTAAAAAEPSVRVDNSDSLDDSGDLVAPSFASIFRVWANLRTRTWCGRGAGPTPMWQSAKQPIEPAGDGVVPSPARAPAGFGRLRQATSAITSSRIQKEAATMCVQPGPGMSPVLHTKTDIQPGPGHVQSGPGRILWQHGRVPLRTHCAH